MSILPYVLFFPIGGPLISKLMKEADFYNKIMRVSSFLQDHICIFIVIGISIGILFSLFSCFITIKLMKK